MDQISQAHAAAAAPQTFRDVLVRLLPNPRTIIIAPAHLSESSIYILHGDNKNLHKEITDTLYPLTQKGYGILPQAESVPHALSGMSFDIDGLAHPILDQMKNGLTVLSAGKYVDPIAYWIEGKQPPSYNGANSETIWNVEKTFMDTFPNQCFRYYKDQNGISYINGRGQNLQQLAKQAIALSMTANMAHTEAFIPVTLLDGDPVLCMCVRDAITELTGKPPSWQGNFYKISKDDNTGRNPVYELAQIQLNTQAMLKTGDIRAMVANNTSNYGSPEFHKAPDLSIDVEKASALIGGLGPIDNSAFGMIPAGPGGTR